MSFDYRTCTEEGYVMRTERGTYVRERSYSSHSGSHSQLFEGPMAEATVYPAEHFAEKLGSRVDCPGELVAVHVVRTTNTVISETFGGAVPPN